MFEQAVSWASRLPCRRERGREELWKISIYVTWLLISKINEKLRKFSTAHFKDGSSNLRKKKNPWIVI